MRLAQRSRFSARRSCFFSVFSMYSGQAVDLVDFSAHSIAMADSFRGESKRNRSSLILVSLLAIWF